MINPTTGSHIIIDFSHSIILEGNDVDINLNLDVYADFYKAPEI